MIFISGLLVGFMLGVFAIGTLGVLLVTHRPKYVAPTMRRRQYVSNIVIQPKPENMGSGADLANVGDVNDPPLYMYGVTGFEDQ